MQTKVLSRLVPFALLAGTLGGCSSGAPTFLAPAEAGKGPVVNFDVYHRPFAEIPLPNDFATRYDATSPTLRRLNASVLEAKTTWEQETRAQLDKLSGWGTLAPITVSFSAPIDPEVIFKHHFNDDFDYSDDAVLVLDVTPGSPGFCEAVPLDLGQGNYPQVLANPVVFESDPRANLQTLTVEETEEDTNGNGVLDPGEDTDMDGVLDHPDTRDGTPGGQRLEFYERETNTLIMKPVMPMREATTYAVVLTKRLTSPAGDPVRSPFEGINHAAQTDALKPLPGCLSQYGLDISDVAFAWSFTTQNITHDYRLVRDGLYGLGPLAETAKDFPATLSHLDDVIDPGPGVNTKVVPMAKFIPLALQLLQLTGSSSDQVKVFKATMANVDFVAAGTIASPQFFPRKDASGAMLPLYRQVWNLDAKPRSEDVPFWLFVPKNRKGPAPVAIFIHGHGGSMFDALPFAGILASYGIATLGIDAPSHGIALPPTEMQLLRSFFDNAGLSGLADALLDGGRAIDWTGDGQLDSGDDYWSAYVFHTRDMVRQTVVDVMQVVRTLRAFDGKAHWAFDPTRTGTPGLAGDFDGDGKVDVGGAAPLHVLGGSLGGILSSVIAGLEPQISDAVAIVPGGMLSEIGSRSTLHGITDAMVLRTLGPLFYEDQGALMLRANQGQTSDVALKIADLPTLSPEDTVVLRNQKTHEYRCAAVQASGTFRVSVSSDAGDPLELTAYHGPLLPKTPEGCVLPTDAPYVDLKTFGYDTSLDGTTWKAGTPLVAPCDGFGMRRATPDLRRFLGLSQVALDAADPMNWAPYWDGTRKMTYGTGETVHTHVIVMPSAGDPGVMVADGIALARAAGFIPYDHDDARYGKSDNQVMIDTYSTEGTFRLGRYHDSNGNPVLMDVEHLASVVPVDDGLDVPRLDPPLRLMEQDPTDGSWHGFILPMLDPQGKHGFVAPDPSKAFDLGSYLLNIIGRYLESDGQDFSWDKCQETSTCSWPTFPRQ